MVQVRAGGGFPWGAVRVPVTWVFSLYVVQAGSACLRGCAGRPAPTAFNRAGEKLQATGGKLPRVSGGVGPRRPGGLALPPHRGGRSRAPRQRVRAGWGALVRLPLAGGAGRGGRRWRRRR